MVSRECSLSRVLNEEVTSVGKSLRAGAQQVQKKKNKEASAVGASKQEKTPGSLLSVMGSHWRI